MDAITKTQAKDLWIHAQKLNSAQPFGSGIKATTAAIEHLGYVQIDTISVIERSHHHILFTRIPRYKIEDLHQAQTNKKSVFEYWTHALAYVPSKDFRFFMPDMKARSVSTNSWYGDVSDRDLKKILSQIKKEGALSIRDFQDEVLVDKSHPWASRKPSKKVLQRGFHIGKLVISERIGMLKKYELTDRHFDWKSKPKAATEKEVSEYLLQRSLRSQSFVSLDSICYLNSAKKPAIQKLIEQKVKSKELVALQIEGVEKPLHWIRPEDLDLLKGRKKSDIKSDRIHLLSPFDPLVIQRKRMKMLFDYEHRFEAYFPKEKRVYGYFGLPVLVGDEMAAVVDLKTDRNAKKLLIQQWSWLGKSKSAALKARIEEELDRFEAFQLRKSL